MDAEIATELKQYFKETAEAGMARLRRELASIGPCIGCTLDRTEKRISTKLDDLERSVIAIADKPMKRTAILHTHIKNSL